MCVTPAFRGRDRTTFAETAMFPVQKGTLLQGSTLDSECTHEYSLGTKEKRERGRQTERQSRRQRRGKHNLARD